MRCIRNLKLIRSRNKQPKTPKLTWSSLQHLLEIAVPPVLIILDCCFAANAARDTTEDTTKEILAACGRENPTLGVGSRSFTSALIEELINFGHAPFTVAMLHSRLVTMRWRLAFTPVYALLSEQGGHSIELGPLLQSSPIPKSSLTPTPSQQSLSVTAADTRVLLAVSIIGDAVPDISQWKSWLTSQTPWDVSKIDVKIEGVFESHSTLLLASMPIFAWDNLPHNAAYHFVGFVKSSNLEQPRSSSRLAAKKSRTQLSPPLGASTPSLADLAFVSRASIGKKETSSTVKSHVGSRISDSVYESPSIPQKRSFAAGPWNSEDDAKLMRARREGMNWEPIAKMYFPTKSANTCRKRHERLIDKRKTNENWDSAKLEAMEVSYYNNRERMWKTIADEINGEWQTVESKVDEDLISTPGSKLLTFNLVYGERLEEFDQ